ncbi:MFS transporter [Intrasporangium oryzae NRRL B-24470]|uniref:MFS transporter n=1 Tax=Intrasporangium oryzae NRRL B-24470 TaxID=1386089 RepID=W9GA09_9MICO|nr:MFS transporter [Intrasporangium oryzae]EWT02057.1 MFS transporter [Intrasporangium oryzae NRRL B-24470]
MTQTRTRTDVAPRVTDAPGRLPLFVLLAGIFLNVLDFFIVNVALPSIERDLHATATALEWVVAGYGLAYGALLLAATRVGDRWGRRRMYAAGTALFVVTSAACGLAPTMDVLMAARFVQGVGAAMLTPMVLALIGDVYSGAAYRRAVAAYSMAMGLAAVSGQLIGGILIELDLFGLGWRSIFLVNVPVGVLTLALLRRAVPDVRVARAPRLDLIEVALLTSALVAVLLPLLEGPSHGWPLWTWLSLAGAAVLTLPLVARAGPLQRRGDDPLLRVVIDATPSLRLGLARQFLLFLGMASYFLVLALYLQTDRGLGALESGALFGLVAVPYLVGTSRAAVLVARWGRLVAPASAVVFLAGHLLTWVGVADAGAHGSALWLAPGLVVSGFGMGVCLTAQIGAVMSQAKPADAALVSGTMSTVQQLGNCIGVALVGLIYFTATTAGVGVAFQHSLVYLAGVMGVLAAVAALPARRTSAVPA